MRRLIVQEFVTLDGLAAGPEGEVDFIPAATTGDAKLGENQMRFIDSIDTIVLGRTTYEMFADYWPTATGDDTPFADTLNATPKLVFSKTLDRAPWCSWDDATKSRARRRVPALAPARRPGGGTPLFAEGIGKIEMTLLDTKTSDKGSTLLRYEPR